MDSSRLQAANGELFPRLGLGVYASREGLEIKRAMQTALDAGYRLFDTAAMYGNEVGVGEAIRASKVPREEIVVTTKVWNSDQGYDSTLRAFDNSLEKLGLDKVDLYLIHWPVKGRYKETWKALEHIYRSGRAGSIGVSNFQKHHLEDVLSSCEVAPMINQIELHPRLQQNELVDFCHSHNIQVTCWSPIMKGRVMEIPELRQIGQKYGKTPVQTTLRWQLQRQLITIPKSSNPVRIRGNAHIFDFELTEEDMAKIARLDQGVRIGPDPDNFNF